LAKSIILTSVKLTLILNIYLLNFFKTVTLT